VNSGWPEEVLPNNDPAIKEVVNNYISLECGYKAINKTHCVPEGLDHCVVCLVIMPS